jgi:hypothetical protein
MPYHVVKQGETLMAIAAKSGLESWKAIHDAPENAELTKVRPDPGVLRAGDRWFVPSRELKHKPAAVDDKHPFTIKRPKGYVRIAVRDADGAPLAGTYLLSAGGKSASGAIPADGLLKLTVPVDTTSGSLVVTFADGTTETWNLRIGHLDPLAEISGVQARLNNLGFVCGEPTGTVNDATTHAVKAFQARVGLEPTGTIDDALREKLAAYYDAMADERTLDAPPAADDDASGGEAAAQ